MIKKFVIFGLMLGLLITPGLVAADGGSGEQSPDGGAKFINPLGKGASANSIGSFLVRIINWLLGLSAILALLSLVVGGLRMITAIGNDQGIAKAKTIVLWALIGLAVIALSYVMVQIVLFGVLGVR